MGTTECFQAPTISRRYTTVHEYSRYFSKFYSLKSYANKKGMCPNQSTTKNDKGIRVRHQKKPTILLYSIFSAFNHILLPSINSVWLSTLLIAGSPLWPVELRQCFALGIVFTLLSSSSTLLVSNSLCELSFLETSTPIVTLISLSPGRFCCFCGGCVGWLVSLVIEKSDIGILPFSTSPPVFLPRLKNRFERLVLES